VDPVAPPQRRRRKRIVRALVIAALVVAIVPLVALELGYQIEIARIAERPPDPVPSFPPLLVRSLAVQLFDTPDPQMTPIHPWTPVIAMARGYRGNLTPEALVASILLGKSQGSHRRSNTRWAIDNGVLATWISRHLTAREAISVALSEMNFGRETAGIDAAARRFFEKSAHDLDAGEVAALLALSHRTSLADRPEELRKARDGLLRRLRAAEVIDEPTMQAAMERDVRRFK
jgi:Transglycosylase